VGFTNTSIEDPSRQSAFRSILTKHTSRPTPFAIFVLRQTLFGITKSLAFRNPLPATATLQTSYPRYRRHKSSDRPWLLQALRKTALTFRPNFAAKASSFGVELDPRRLSRGKRAYLVCSSPIGIELNPIVVRACCIVHGTHSRSEAMFSSQR
jgi:hypothetical protein